MQKAVRCMIHFYDILGKGTARETENSNSCWGVAMGLLQRDTGEFSGVLGLFRSQFGWLYDCIYQNPGNYTLKRVNFTACQIRLNKEKKKKKAARAG